MDVIERHVVAEVVDDDRAFLLLVKEAFVRADTAFSGLSTDLDTYLASRDTVDMRAMLKDRYSNPPAHGDRLPINWRYTEDLIQASIVMGGFHRIERMVMDSLDRYPHFAANEPTLLQEGHIWAACSLRKGWSMFFFHCRAAWTSRNRREEMIGQYCLDMWYKVAMGTLHSTYENFCRGIDLTGGWCGKAGDANVVDVDRFLQMDTLRADAERLVRDLRWIHRRMVGRKTSAAGAILDRIQNSPSFNDRGAVWSANWPDKTTFNQSTWVLGLDRLESFMAEIRTIVDRARLGDDRVMPSGGICLPDLWECVYVLVENKVYTPLYHLLRSWSYQRVLSEQFAWTMARDCTAMLQMTLVLAVEYWART